MPMLDVTEVLFDPDFADMFDVLRQSEVVDDSGRAQIGKTRFPNVIGVVTPTAPDTLQRRDDGQMMPRAVSVVTQFRLRGPSPGFQPDQIVYDNVTFTVTEIVSLTRFGEGFVEAIALSMNALNGPPA